MIRCTSKNACFKQFQLIKITLQLQELVVKYELMCKDPFCTRKCESYLMEDFLLKKRWATQRIVYVQKIVNLAIEVRTTFILIGFHFLQHFPGWHSIIVRAASSPTPPTPLSSLNFLVHEQWIESNPHISPNSANFKRTGSGGYVATALVSSLTSPETLSNHIIPYSACCKQMYRLSNPGRKQKRDGCVIYGLMC
ncbi:hypothetical protein T07_1181 [Trichinella nelsoni]|uniref:Uncharacterized protein n=1 Tax=Trichinella nelsoni TaxID=6336 RepID=A0A0V0RSV6_9BILA|nr:hypothetical protein T07_6157 [Trichinella nelsoni]KRX17565.1 hypothetical protein T07_1181 [Trichinella nelsoni]